MVPFRCHLPKCGSPSSLLRLNQTVHTASRKGSRRQSRACANHVNYQPQRRKMAKSYDHLFKLLLIGDSDVGKTKIFERFKDNTFNSTYERTISETVCYNNFLQLTGVQCSANI